MNVRSERMSASARFTDTAQLGRLCKNCVRRRFRGVQGGSLSKKLRLNQPYTCVRKVSARFPCPWPHFRGSRRPVLRPWRRCRPVCTRAAGYPALNLRCPEHVYPASRQYIPPLLGSLAIGPGDHAEQLPPARRAFPRRRGPAVLQGDILRGFDLLFGPALETVRFGHTFLSLAFAINTRIAAHCFSHSGVAVWQLHQGIPIW